MWQNIIIAVIVLLCALYVGRKFCRQARGQAGCCSGGGGCSGCTPPAGGSGSPGQSAGNPPDCGGAQR